jgi:hypothetical protein
MARGDFEGRDNRNGGAVVQVGGGVERRGGIAGMEGGGGEG